MNRGVISFASLFPISLPLACLISCSALQARTHVASAEQEIDEAPRATDVDTRPNGLAKETAYPEALRGTWRLDPLRRPCVLPLSPDSDGRFIVKAHVIESYESTYSPVSVEADPDKKNSWRIVSIENHLGTQKETVRHSFAVEGDQLVEQDGNYRAVYMKCKERGR